MACPVLLRHGFLLLCPSSFPFLLHEPPRRLLSDCSATGRESSGDEDFDPRLLQSRCPSLDKDGALPVPAQGQCVPALVSQPAPDGAASTLVVAVSEGPAALVSYQRGLGSAKKSQTQAWTVRGPPPCCLWG